MALFTVSMLKNEESRFLASAISTWSKFSDEILILDDDSTDGTREIARGLGARVFEAVSGPAAWGNEAPKRAHLWRLAWAEARIDDYILILDGDMTPANDPRVFMDSRTGAIAFTLFDLWGTSPLVYREDSFWRGHLFPRIWMVKKTKENAMRSWEWSTRGIHSGHLPLNFSLPESYALLYAPRVYSLLHYAYSNPTLRDDKYVSYASVASSLTAFEIEHAKSIRDPEPAVFNLEFSPTYNLEYQGDLG